MIFLVIVLAIPVAPPQIKLIYCPQLELLSKFIKIAKYMPTRKAAHAAFLSLWNPMVPFDAAPQLSALLERQGASPPCIPHCIGNYPIQ